MCVLYAQERARGSPAGQKLVSIMSSDRRDGNIRDERNIELDEKRGIVIIIIVVVVVIVSYGSGRRASLTLLSLARRFRPRAEIPTSNSPCFLDIVVVVPDCRL